MSKGGVPAARTISCHVRAAIARENTDSSIKWSASEIEECIIGKQGAKSFEADLICDRVCSWRQPGALAVCRRKSIYAKQSKKRESPL